MTIEIQKVEAWEFMGQVYSRREDAEKAKALATMAEFVREENFMDLELDANDRELVVNWLLKRGKEIGPLLQALD